MDVNEQKALRTNSSKKTQPLNLEHKRIADWLSKVSFKKQLIGGVSEIDVWKKIEKLNSMYNAALIAERVRYDTLLEQMRNSQNTNFGNNGGS